MGILIGPNPWWQANIVSVCPVGTILPDGSKIICKAGGTAWIVAPANTQVTQTWNNTTTLLVGNKPCVCDWPTLNTGLINCGFNPGDWFVPSISQLQNPGYVCRTQWDSFSAALYWSSTGFNSGEGCSVLFTNSNTSCCGKSFSNCVRAFRCVTY